MLMLILRLFGRPRLEQDGQPIEFQRNKTLALLAYLALEQRPVSREMLALLLWPDYANSRAALRNVLHELNKVLDRAGLESDRKTVYLPPEAVWVDVNAFSQLLAGCRQHGHGTAGLCTACLSPLVEAVSLYQEPFMAGFSLGDSINFDTWQQQQGETLQRDLSELLEKLAGVHELTGDFPASLDYARQWLEMDSLNEAAHRRLMTLLAESGRRSEALRQYQSCLRILDEELGIEPQEETTALYVRLRDGTPLPADRLLLTFQQPLPNAGRKDNLPVQPTPFIGREKELATIAERLQEPACRLLTLVGLGGVGKTRLAVEAARRQIENFADGVYFVDLAPLSSGNLLSTTVAEAVGFAFYSQEAPIVQLLNYLSRKQILLVLDNFEHLIDEAGLLSEITRTAPGVQLVVTSRERLHLVEEWLFQLKGLSVPAAHDSLKQRPAGEYEATQLFIQSAKRVQPDFSLETTGEEDVIEICRLVEGLPLGVELAAAWVRALSCQEIAQQLHECYDFLATTTRNVAGPPMQHAPGSPRSCSS
jgi:DNA-binding SARP family transcriptional activator